MYCTVWIYQTWSNHQYRIVFGMCAAFEKEEGWSVTKQNMNNDSSPLFFLDLVPKTCMSLSEIKVVLKAIAQNAFEDYKKCWEWCIHNEGNYFCSVCRKNPFASSFHKLQDWNQAGLNIMLYLYIIMLYAISCWFLGIWRWYHKHLCWYLLA